MAKATTARTEPRRRKVPRPIREQQILDAADACFAKRGYHDASMDEIADLTGITKPMIYAYFGSKEGLYLAVIERAGRDLVERIASATTVLDAEAQLWYGALAFFEFVLERRDGWKVLYREATASAQGAAQAVVRYRARVADLIAEQLRQGGDAATVRAAGADAISHAVAGAAESLANWSLEHPGVSAENLTRHFFTLVWNGIGVTRSS